MAKHLYDLKKELRSRFGDLVQTHMEDLMPLSDRSSQTERLKESLGLDRKRLVATNDLEQALVKAFYVTLDNRDYNKTVNEDSTIFEAEDGCQVEFYAAGGHLAYRLRTPEQLQERVRDNLEADWDFMNDDEKAAVTKINQLAVMYGGQAGVYSEGTLEVEFDKKQAVLDYLDALNDEDSVDDYEVEAYLRNAPENTDATQSISFDDIEEDSPYAFTVWVYLVSDLVTYAPVEIEVPEDGEVEEPDNGAFMEVKRRIKINFRGKRRIKMVCNKGFKYNVERKTCEKLSGKEIAISRIAHRHAVRTKKSKGKGFLVRIERKTRKAMRFRKAQGLTPGSGR